MSEATGEDKSKYINSGLVGKDRPWKSNRGLYNMKPNTERSYQIAMEYKDEYQWVIDHGVSSYEGEPRLMTMEEFKNMGATTDLLVKGSLIYEWKGWENGATPRFRMYEDEKVQDALLDLHRDEICEDLARKDRTF